LWNSYSSIPFWHLTRASEAIIKHSSMPINITKERSEQEFNVGMKGLREDIFSFKGRIKEVLRERFEKN
jgi:hypothetical protein